MPKLPRPLSILIFWGIYSLKLAQKVDVHMLEPHNMQFCKSPIKDLRIFYNRNEGKGTIKERFGIYQGPPRLSVSSLAYMDLNRKW